MARFEVRWTVEEPTAEKVGKTATQAFGTRPHAENWIEKYGEDLRDAHIVAI